MKAESEWFLKRAARVRATPRFDMEREERLELAARLCHLLDAARKGAALSPSLNELLLSRQWPPHLAERINAWAGSNEASLRRALLAFVGEQGGTAEERFRRFLEAVKAAADARAVQWHPSIVLMFGSMLNFAIEPQSLPVVRDGSQGFVQLERTLGYDSKQAEGLDEQYENHLAFARHLHTEMVRASIPVRDMIDVEACIAYGLRGARESLPRLPSAAPIQLLRDPEWIMSLGERAALEGIVSQVEPKLALEIGAGQGGSLRRIAAHSDEVHELDLKDPSPSLRELENVHWHTGDSHELLPQLLRRFAEEGRNVDFALVDGDHTPAGVRRDVEDLLDSPAVGRTVIVVHDTMNEAVRSGLEQVEYERIPKVVYVELDFVPGYMFREPRRRYQLWGGLGLIVVDQDSSSPMVRQDRYYEAHPLIREVRQLVMEREASGDIAEPDA
jgi:methyltransferase family protein